MKTINRNNYEEFFLLYIDDELDAASRLAVENFVQQHTDLAAELETLLQFKFPPENIVFENKDVLLKTEGNSINETNYEEYFLLYIDNELSAAKREEVEMYVLQHPKLQDEFTLLKQFVLAPETISYGDKTDLYRTEKRRTFYIKPWRFAAAAIFAGFCITGWFLMQKPAPGNMVADNNTTEQQPENKTIETTPVDSVKHQPEQIIPQQPVHQQLQHEYTTVKTDNKKMARTPVSTIKKENATLAITSHNEKKEVPLVVVQQRSEIVHNNIQDLKEPSVVIKDMAIEPLINEKQNNDITSLQASATDKQIANNYSVYTVAYKEINTDDDDRSLHVGMFDLNKDKVKGLFKKAGRMLGNKSPDLANEDGKLQIANFEIDTKKL